MNAAQRASAAREFLDKLREPKWFDAWMAVPKDDPAKVGDLVKQALGLDAAPTTDDLKAMSHEIERDLRALVQATQQASISWTGAMFASQSQ